MSDHPVVVKRVAVGIPLKGHTPPESYHDRMIMAFTMGCIETAQKNEGTSPRYEFFWFNVGEIHVAFAREQLAALARQYKCDYLFMIDDDMLAPPDLFYRLAKHDVDVVAALAFTRNPPHRPVIYATREGYDKVSGKDYFQNETVYNYPRNSLVECDAVGFGAVLIKTAVFDKLEAPIFFGEHGTGEDVLFCIRAKKAGARIFMDTSVKLGHLTHHGIVTEEYSDAYNKMTPEEKDRLYGQYHKYPTMDLAR